MGCLKRGFQRVGYELLGNAQLQNIRIVSVAKCSSRSALESCLVGDRSWTYRVLVGVFYLVLVFRAVDSISFLSRTPTYYFRMGLS